MNTIAKRILENAVLTPQKVAIVDLDGTRETSWAELHETAVKIALHVRREGLQGIVPILQGRRMEYVASILGLNLAGLAAVNLSDTYPQERVRYICEDVGATTYIDAAFVERALAFPAEPFEPCGDLDTIAMLLYTSGSTGKPKGIVYDNNCLLQAIQRNIKQMELGSEAVYAGSASFSFSAVHFDVLSALASGAVLHILSETCRSDVTAMAEYFNQYGITHVFLSPQIHKQLHVSIPSLKIVFTGSERVFGIAPRDYRIILFYGMSESTVAVTYFTLDKAYDNTPIGKLGDGMSIYLLDEDGYPCDEGEICIAGSIAKGYWNRPELAAKTFVQNPFATGEHDKVLLHTGDLGKRLPDGNYLYLNRKDWMVKINGQRVEPGEVEAVMHQLPAIKQAVVKGFENDYGQTYLCAFYTQNNPITDAEIRAYLAKSLPDYMQPRFLVALESFPVNANGKLDRLSLKAPEAALFQAEYVEPTTPAAEALCHAFQQVLGVGRCGALDDFFAMGGDSIGAVRLMEAAEGLPLKATDIMQGRTPRGIAKLLSENDSALYENLPANVQSTPLTDSQLNVYLECIKNPDATIYHIPFVCVFDGKNPTADALVAAVNQITALHPALFSHIEMQDGVPCMVRHQPVTLCERLQAAESDLIRIKTEFVCPFELSKSPLCRFLVVETETRRYLLGNLHHIIADGSSLSLLLAQLGEVLAGAAPKAETVDPFALYELECRQKNAPSYRLAHDYFEKLLCDTTVDSKLLPDKHLQKETETRINLRHVFPLGDTLSPQLVERAIRAMGVTENTFFLTAFGFALAKMTGQNKSLFCTADNGRHNPRVNDNVSMMVRTLPVFMELEGENTTDKLLYKQQKVLFETIQHDSYSFGEMVREFGLRLDVMFVYQGTLMDGVHLANGFVPIENLPVDATTSSIDVMVFKEKEGYRVEILGRADLYEAATIERFGRYYAYILGEFLKKQLLSEVSTIIPAEREQILVEFNDTARDYPRDKTIVDLFEEQVAKTPDNIALIFEDEEMTYAQLNAKANQLAHKLLEMGVQPDDFVAMLTQRSFEMIVGIFGILKAGGAYVPMDPSYPEERIRYMLEDCQPKVILTYEATIATEIPVIDLADSRVWEGAVENPEAVNKPSDLAYCIYTSGTTGKPKGVLVEHHGIVNIKNIHEKHLDLTESDRVLLFPNYIFDTFVEDMLMALFTGAILIIAQNVADIGCFYEICKKNKVTVADLPPNFYAQVNDVKLKLVITGGSATSGDIVLNSKAERYINAYGPTENTVSSTYWEYTGGELTTVPIGKPISNVQIYILQDMQLCGIGIPGELCIAGDGLARGYLNRPELTAEKFIQNPFGAGRLYRTGDLARWLPDGNIEFLGRIDEQVKIRGFRVELGEIESALRGIETVKDCTVIARNDAGGDMAIHAYIVSENEISVLEIRATLSETLPSYMIPAYMMQLERIPVNASGKVDKRALPEIVAESGKAYVAPRNEMEAMLCGVFGEVLHVEKVSVTDSFFELGGHSLRATKLSNQIEVQTGCKLPLREVFTHPTVELLAKLVLSSVETEYIPIPQAEEKAYYPMSSTQKRTYLVCQMDEDGISYNMPQSLILTGEVSPDAIRLALQQLIDRHEILRTEFLLVEGEPVQKILANVDADFVYLEDFGCDSSTIISEFIRPFDLRKAPLVRAKLVKRSENEYLFLPDMHHIVGDGMSMDTFTREFAALYNDASLEPLTHQYKDYSEWMRTRDLEAQKTFWVEQFSDEIPVLDMPLDFSRPQVQSYKGGMVFAETGVEIGEKIKVLSRKTGATEYMILLSAAMVLLSKYSRQEDVVIGSPISGRTHKDTEQMLGMFVNTLAMRGKPERSKTFAAFLNEIKEFALKAYENQEYPFEELVEAVAVRRDMARNPLFDVMLVLQNNETSELKLDGIAVKAAGLDSTIAKFDLTFNIVKINGNYALALEYCTDLFRTETAERILAHYMELLCKIAECKDVRIADIALVTSAEREQILVEFNDTARDYPRDKTIVDLFEEQVAKTPENIAVVFEDRRICYSELDEITNRIAAYIISLGIVKEDVVAVLIPRGEFMPIAALSILKAGAAYQPLDPSHPQERIDFMLHDAGAKLLISDALLQQKLLPNYTGLTLKTQEFSDLPKANIELPKTSSSDMFNLLYTSGSTGTPKGCVYEHRNIAAFCHWYIHYYKLDSTCAVAAYSSFGFDAHMMDLYPALITGASCHIIPDERRLSLEWIRDYFNENEITHVFMTTQMGCKFANEINGIKTLHHCIVGGEQLLPIKPPAEYCFINGYGPSECTIFSTIFSVDKHYPVIPIGKPISNTQIYILQDMQLCGIGIPGELCIAGDGLARGYLGRPELTAEKFIQNPFGEGRLYRTGDLARWLPDGNIAFLGRIDEQVKIRGFRVELGEIESALRAMESVKDCTVIARNDAGGDMAIHAYIVSNIEISTAAIRTELGKTLPHYMIPSYMMQLERIPVNASGKVDKRALPEIVAQSGKEYVAPRNPIEATFCEIFSEVLQIKQVGVLDDFFLLGGTSLRVSKVIFASTQAGYPLVYKDVFAYTTPCALAKLFTEEPAEEPERYNIKDYEYETLDGVLHQNCMEHVNEVETRPLGNLLLTGATGFLGIHVLREFLENESGHAYCLVRSNERLDSQKRLATMLMYYFSIDYDEQIGQRIHCIDADITDFNTLVQLEALPFDTVINCAALVKHFVYDDSLERANITAVRNLIALCMRQHKRLIQISTASVSGMMMDNHAADLPMLKENALYIGQTIDNEYVYTKFQAERSMLEAISQGLDGKIMRVGNLMSRNRDSEFQVNFRTNAFMRQLRSYIVLGAFPMGGMHQMVEFSPIDSTAAAIIRLAATNTCFSVFSPYNSHEVLFSDIIHAMKQQGFSIQVVSDAVFASRIASKQSEKAATVLGALTVYDSRTEETHRFVATDNRFTTEVLDRLGFSWPVTSTEYLESTLSLLSGLGFFENL